MYDCKCELTVEGNASRTHQVGHTIHEKITHKPNE